ncbi:hypothetical protein GCM10009804_02420 [Kribbella hippodromi]|uniref:FtsX-like permease family protein n=1 Tax=Kribbella hippodromi TaxID=434347 RepID=A0ABN2BYE0_9ACTN
MTPKTLVLLARSRTPADRGRVRLATAAFALSGALLINALHVARLGGGELSRQVHSAYIAQSGLRPGLIAVLVVLALSTAGLAVQALRLGTAARERRLAALRLAGASSRQVRQLSVTDTAMAGLAGGLLAGPVYLLLSLVFAALPQVTRVFPGLELLDAALWAPVVATTTAVAALTGSLLHHVGPGPHQPQSRTRWRSSLVAGPFLIVLGLLSSTYLGLLASPITLAGIAVLAGISTRRWIRAVGRWLQRSGDPANLLTGVRLTNAERSATRMCVLLGLGGFVIGALADAIVSMLADNQYAADATFYATGYGLAITGMLLITLTVLATIIVGVADQLVDQRRQLAGLTALGVDLPFLRRVIRRQLTVVAAPALSVGLLLGVVTGMSRMTVGITSQLGLTKLLVAVALSALGWLIGHLGGAAACYLLRNQLRDALAPENLRAA